MSQGLRGNAPGNYSGGGVIRDPHQDTQPTTQVGPNGDPLPPRDPQSIKGNVDETMRQWTATHASAPPPGGSSSRGKVAVPDAQTATAQKSSSADKNSPAPTPYDAATLQGQVSKDINNDTINANRPNINTPYGGQQWQKNPDGTWSMGVGYNDALGGASNSLTGQAAANFGTPLDNGSAARDQAIKAAYGQATSRLNPQWQQSDEQLGSQLASQGLDPNSQAYRTAMQGQSMAKNDAYSSAMNNAIGQGTAAQQATFNESLAARDAPLSELKSMYGLLPGTGFNAAGSSQTPDYMQAQQNALQQQLQQQAITAQYVTAGVNAGSSILNASSQSDERVKQDIHRLPVEAAPGVPLATFAYKQQPGQKYVGVIAQDLEKVAPQHVATGPDGIKRVSEPFRPFAIGSGDFKPFGLK